MKQENNIFNTRKNNHFMRSLFEALELTPDLTSQNQHDIMASVNSERIELSELCRESIDALKDTIFAIYSVPNITREQINSHVKAWTEQVFDIEFRGFDGIYDKELEAAVSRQRDREAFQAKLTPAEQKLLPYMEKLKAVPSKVFEGHYYYTIEVNGSPSEAMEVAHAFKNENMRANVVRPRDIEGPHAEQGENGIRHVRIHNKDIKSQCPNYTEKVDQQHQKKTQQDRRRTMMDIAGKGFEPKNSASQNDIMDIRKMADQMREMGLRPSPSTPEFKSTQTTLRKCKTTCTLFTPDKTPVANQRNGGERGI